jgi:hypothetical protein
MTGNHEKGFDEIFTDPIVLMLMKSDRIAPEDARQLFSEVADRIRRRRLGLREDDSVWVSSRCIESQVA